MPKYPIYLELQARRVVVVGAGPVAARKLLPLVEAGARIVVVSLEAESGFAEFCERHNIELVMGGYSKQYLADAVLAIAATNDLLLNRQIYEDCRQLGVLCNVVDQPELCDFFVPAIVKRGPLQIAISTDGNCPAYSAHLRGKIEGLISEQHGQFVAQLENVRGTLMETIADTEQRKVLLGMLVADSSFEYFRNNGCRLWHEYAKKLISGNKGPAKP